MDHPSFFQEQIEIAGAPISSKIFLEGPAGAGKTTTGVLRMLALIQAGVPANSILILIPQRTLGQLYQQEFRKPGAPPGSIPTIVTLGGLGQRMLNLFWPLIARDCGFSRTTFPPTFLTMETAQYYLARLVREKLEAGFFQTIKVDRNRLLSQIIDNLNKAAGVGFDHGSIADRLKTAWIGEPAQHRAYEEAQICANEFRQFCLKHNLLDFSLQMECFVKSLWNSFLCRAFLVKEYRHLIYDNIEEDVPVVHDIIRQWLPEFESALLIYDSNAGYRSFLGADPESGYALQAGCNQLVTVPARLEQTIGLANFRECLQAKLIQSVSIKPNTEILNSISFSSVRYVPEMVEQVAEQIHTLLENRQVPPNEIVILSPFLPDSLRFSLTNALLKKGIKSSSHRPSRSLREEPAAQCLITLAKLAHPGWKMVCSPFDVRSALFQAIDGLDLNRADLLVKIAYRTNKPFENLGAFDLINPDMQVRITYALGEKYEMLRTWINNYRNNPPVDLDIFLSRIFEDVLSRKGFSFHRDLDAVAVTARLVESAQKFRRSATAIPDYLGDIPVGAEYIRMVDEGVIAAQYLDSWLEKNTDSIFIAPAYTFLLSNRPVEYQFWLDIGSRSWWERLYQPLTHPYVLSRKWQEGRPWTDADEVATNQKLLNALVNGLIRRCRKGLFLVSNRSNEKGDEQRGPLLIATQSIFRQIAVTTNKNNV